MKTVLGHINSLCFWRSHRLDETISSKVTSLSDCACSLKDIDTITLYRMGFSEDVIDLLVPSDKKRRKTRGLELNYWKGPLPSGALRKVSGDLYVESPEMCFLQFAKHHSLIETVFLGYELCGSYPTKTEDLHSEDPLPPVTTRAKLERFVARSPMHGGVQMARAVCKYIRDDSASHMESAVTMLLCLPPRLGGYGLPFPEMNGKVKMGKKAREIGKKQGNRCDLYWRQEKVALEYNSELHHAERHARNSDARRNNVLGYSDRTVVVLTWEAVKDPEEFEGVAKILCKHLGLRPPRIRMDRADFVFKRNVLRKAVLPHLAERR